MRERLDETTAWYDQQFDLNKELRDALRWATLEVMNNPHKFEYDKAKEIRDNFKLGSI